MTQDHEPDATPQLTLFNEANDDPLAPVRVARMLVASLLIACERNVNRVEVHRVLWRVARLLDTATKTNG